MKKALISVIIILSIYGLAAFYDLRSSPNQEIVEYKEEPAFPPDLCLETIGDSSCIRLSKLKDKVVILNFWASWCSPCIVEFPFLLETIKKFNGKVILVAVSIDTAQNDIEKFKERLPEKFQNIIDSERIYWVHDMDKSISQDYFNVYKVPETIVIDKNSRTIRKIIGQVDKSSPPLLGIISALVSG